jgi:uncharacterized protein (TIGR03905 family)
MAKKFTYKTQGTCSKSIEIELEGDIVKSVRFEGGCHGNTQGIGLLTRGMQAADVIARLEGIDCKGRGTSCPDQLAKALVRPSDNNGYDETRERSGSPKSGETKEKQKQLYRQSHRSRKWRCRCLSVARPDCGNGRLNEKESAAHPGRGKSRNLFGKIR